MSVLIDKYGRTLNYLRLSVTDRCNFRCYYCMPEHGMSFVRKEDLLSFEELYRLCHVFTRLGVSKVRITGGEPFVRDGLMVFLKRISALDGLDEITITTNGTLIERHLPALLDLGIRKINLSLDSLNRERFLQITRRDSFDQVMALVFKMLDAGFELKLNCVVSAGKNTEDILPFIALTEGHSVSVRFLEEMPFNGGDHLHAAGWSYKDIYGHIMQHYPDVNKVPGEPTSTSTNYRIPGFAGTFGIIPSFSRTFCGMCNRLRLSATGALRTCLYGPATANLRDMLRSGVDNSELEQAIIKAVDGREPNGFAAEAANAAIHHSMSLLGG